ncbi:hypothetical protein FA09DRAFT_106752 [Tilletiopsis washingtonensis]|jgi:hypothetical protein|uniref:Uncharacterized protein n=1 Tax=Tilletiopsis washingtonensis TaxID=58919 RepID=A0A316Z2T6_9BASI|nr:hypothetical protein FA09DRAFT_106752 [Tilletiopsis washingtonensis]PWN96107.1 hypothetical protein FA09DRAFT_106752 [Tilletiopsis washingtonensis]
MAVLPRALPCPLCRVTVSRRRRRTRLVLVQCAARRWVLDSGAGGQGFRRPALERCACTRVAEAPTMPGAHEALPDLGLASCFHCASHEARSHTAQRCSMYSVSWLEAQSSAYGTLTCSRREAVNGPRLRRSAAMFSLFSSFRAVAPVALSAAHECTRGCICPLEQRVRILWRRLLDASQSRCPSRRAGVSCFLLARGWCTGWRTGSSTSTAHTALVSGTA